MATTNELSEFHNASFEEMVDEIIDLREQCDDYERQIEELENEKADLYYQIDNI